MTAIKFDSKLATAADDALQQHVRRLYSSLGTRIVGIVELCAVERVQPAPDEDKEPSVKLQVKHLEVAGPDQEEATRRAMRALHTHRTAFGTLNEHEEIELAERTIAECAGEFNAIEAARLHVAIERWTDYARQALHNPKLTASELRHEMDIVARGLRAAIHPDALMPAP